MRRLLTKCFLFLLPVLLLVGAAEYLLRNIPNDYSRKAAMYKQQAGEFQTLILGSSYAFYDLNPAFFRTKTFNGGHSAQTLDLDAALFHKFGAGMTRLKCIVIPISDMSFFWKLSNSDERWKLKNYPIYYKLHVSDNIADYSEVLSLPFSINRNRLISWYIQKKENVTSTPLGYGTGYNSANRQDLRITALKAIRRHTLTDLSDFPTEKRSLEQILDACRARNIRVILFIPPAFDAYASKIDPGQLSTTIHTCEYFQQTYPNVSYFNFLHDTSYKENDYFDADHLNEIGAKKLSLKIDSIINQ
jgi:hypothetical protein